MMRFAVAASLLVLAIHAFNLNAARAKGIFSKDRDSEEGKTALSASKDWPIETLQPATLMSNLWDEFDRNLLPLMRMTPGWSLSGMDQMTNKIAFDVKESEKEYELLADLPGIRKEDMEISIRDHVLTLKAERRKEDIQESENFRRIERFRGWCTRSMHLPENAAESDVKAEYKDGVLRVHIPKLDIPAKKHAIVPIIIAD